MGKRSRKGKSEGKRFGLLLLFLLWNPRTRCIKPRGQIATRFGHLIQFSSKYGNNASCRLPHSHLSKKSISPLVWASRLAAVLGIHPPWTISLDYASKIPQSVCVVRILLLLSPLASMLRPRKSQRYLCMVIRLADFWTIIVGSVRYSVRVVLRWEVSTSAKVLTSHWAR